MASTALRVKELLRKLNWTTKVLAEKTGMSESYLTHIKNATRRWNEDALRKIATAFNLEPLDLFVDRKTIIPPSLPLEGVGEEPIVQRLLKVPVIGDIPSVPSPYHNQLLQEATGYKDVYAPYMGIQDPNMFCLHVENNSLLPKFSKGDYLFISPQTTYQTGSIVAIEYKKDKPHKGIMHISITDDVVVLTPLNHKYAPVALSKSKDSFRVIGTVVCRLQKILRGC